MQTVKLTLHRLVQGNAERQNKAIEEASGAVILMKYCQNTKIIDRIYNLLDGLLIPGGSDLHPKYYGEKLNKKLISAVNQERDKLEVYVLKKAIQDKKPILGICRGIQIINTIEGGTLYQDIVQQLKNPAHTAKRYPCYPDSPRTHITLVKKSKLGQILGVKRFVCNCAHHRAIKDLARGYKVVGESKDGMIEAIEKDSDDHWIIAVQGHPEATLDKRPLFKKLFGEFVRQCRLYSKKK
ncbi:gamma-glutamyl-gamma-aminobutyrate hydrolase family protein [Patescibacteria group bacterium]|nr:gamma-glutamyl-gamma-aminobutyrate hydrolase family protein [Patescibacteria group bacterium]MBU1867934.1 gamma-glutamyl-gamma-aminobutyrate hydrolase family protein [Patescibacteria group bacterium]